MENKETKIKFNIIDVIILILILALIASLVWFFFLKDKTTKVDQQKNVEYTVILKNVKIDYTNIFKVGQNVKNSSSGNSFGTIKNIEIKQSSTVLDSYQTLENDVKMANVGYYDEYCDVYLTIIGKAFVSSQEIFLLDGNKLLIGSSLYLRIGDFAQVAYVVSFSEVK